MVTEKLCNNGIRAAGYHAGMDTDERAYVQEAFQRDDIQIVVATVAFGMGINKPMYALWCTFDIPYEISNLIIKRLAVGRDGLPAEAMMLFDRVGYAVCWMRKKKARKNKLRCIN